MEIEVTTMKEYAIIKSALEVYVAFLSEEYDGRQTKAKLHRLSQVQSVLKQFKALGKKK